MAISKQEVCVCQCERCGFRWIPKTALKDPSLLPVRCGNPRCSSPYWQTPKKTSVVV